MHNCLFVTFLFRFILPLMKIQLILLIQRVQWKKIPKVILITLADKGILSLCVYVLYIFNLVQYSPMLYALILNFFSFFLVNFFILHFHWFNHLSPSLTLPESIHHPHLVHLRILKCLHSKLIEFMLKMVIALWILLQLWWGKKFLKVEHYHEINHHVKKPEHLCRIPSKNAQIHQ